MITIPDDSTPADVIGETDILAGQDWLIQPKLLRFANLMVLGMFDWDEANNEEAMAFQVSASGQQVLWQGHHRWVAARLAGVEIPVTIELLRDFWLKPMPFAMKWTEVTWRYSDDEHSP